MQLKTYVLITPRLEVITRELIVSLIVTMSETILHEYQKLAYYYTSKVHPLSGTINVKI